MASLKWVLMIGSLFSATNVSARRSAALLPRVPRRDECRR